MAETRRKEPSRGRKNPAEAKVQTDTVALTVLGAPAALGILVYSAAEESWSILALSVLVAACAFALGALLGFLFGVPQYFASGGEVHPDAANPTSRSNTRGTYQPNTNLTQVSDWLTKIIIGVGLVEFGQLTDTIGRLGDSLEPSLGGSSAGNAFGIALVVGFFVIGFLVGYLFTRLRLQWAFAAADRWAFADLVEGVIEHQGEADAEALKLKTQQLDPTAEPVPVEQLKVACAKASPAIRVQLRTQALEAKSSAQPVSDRAQALLDAIDQADREQP